MIDYQCLKFIDIKHNLTCHLPKLAFYNMSENSFNFAGGSRSEVTNANDYQTLIYSDKQMPFIWNECIFITSPPYEDVLLIQNYDEFMM